MTFLIADGVVPSNEDRGYILRRIMRRAIQQGRRIGIEPGFLPTFVDQVIEIMGAAYPELERERDSIMLLGALGGGGLRPHARAGHEAARRDHRALPRPSAASIPAPEAFQLHDTFGFPIEVTMRASPPSRGWRSTRPASTSSWRASASSAAAARAATAAPVA